jgi:multidrug efflux pump subunit AcrA (membrane-fusion protein)
VVVHGRRDHGNRSPLPASSSPVNRLDAALAALSAERESRERIEHSLAEAQASIRELQTKFGHATLERDELRAAVRQAETARQSSETALQTAQAALKTAYAERDALEQRLMEAAIASPPMRASPATNKPARGSRFSQRIDAAVELEEPEPVQWWITPAKKTG